MLPYTAGILETPISTSSARTTSRPSGVGIQPPGGGSSGGWTFTSQGGGRREAAFQCERARFDEILLRKRGEGRRAGVENARLTGVITEDGRIVGVRYVAGDQAHLRWRAKFVLDASGRAGVITNQHYKYRRAIRAAAAGRLLQTLSRRRRVDKPRR